MNFSALSFTVREMMLGTRQPFEYVQCSHCDSLQIVEIPKNISEFMESIITRFEKKPMEEIYLSTCGGLEMQGSMVEAHSLEGGYLD
jgi:hypothetical protein